MNAPRETDLGTPAVEAAGTVSLEIDGVAVSEPQVQLPKNLSVSVKRGGVAVPAFGKSLYDYTTLATLLQPCAVGNAARCATAAGLGHVDGAVPPVPAVAELLRPGRAPHVVDVSERPPMVEVAAYLELVRADRTAR